MLLGPYLPEQVSDHLDRILEVLTHVGGHGKSDRAGNALRVPSRSEQTSLELLVCAELAHSLGHRHPR